MPENGVAKFSGLPKKRGRPKGARPLCEKDELAKYPDPKIVVWGIAPACKRFKRKGLAILYNPGHPGGMVTLMPVTDDGDELRWRYRFIPGPQPYRYEKIDLEPGQAGGLPSKLRELADTLEGVVKQNFGDIKGADKTTEDFHKTVKDDELSEKIKKLGLV
jgi:hypothetical protein